MKKLFAGMIVSFLAAAAFAATCDRPAIIPLPQQLDFQAGAFQMGSGTEIFADSGSLPTAQQLARQLRPATGYSFKASRQIGTEHGVAGGIWLTIQNADASLGREGYELIVTTNNVVIRAPTTTGLFYGVQTLLQLLPPAIFSTNPVTHESWQIPCVRIKDWPRFPWRGLMLDVSRHFYNKSDVEKILDLMALHKLNMFHWHLVDDQGWRIEIKKYPLLTQVGAWRKQSALGKASAETYAHPAWAMPSADKFGSDGRYGGFYTQDDIREIVAYAAARHITIVPEIEMPGHSSAALSAYPQFGDNGLGTNRSVSRGIYDPAHAGTFQFLDDVLTEVFQLFPGKYIHIGGDEVKKDFWKNDPECQLLMRREGLKNEEELQSWFVRRMEKFVNAQGRTLIGWSEILQGGLAQNAVVMDWIGGGREAASQGHDVVMTPNVYCYLNYYQSTNHATEPRAQGGYIPLQKIYAFDLIPTNLPTPAQSHILGAQGNLWTEWIASLPHAEYMLFPRACALAEVVWSAKDARDLNDFERRLKTDEARLDQLGVNYRRDPSGSTAVDPDRITTDYIDAKISRSHPGFDGLSVDSLGQKHFSLITIRPPAGTFSPVQVVQKGSQWEYRRRGANDANPPCWMIKIETNEICLESRWSADDPPEPLVFDADNSRCHVTMLGLMTTNGSIRLPALMHFPDQGTFRISTGPEMDQPLGYAAEKRDVKITFPAATQNHPVVTYHCKVVSIHPNIPGIEGDARFDGFRRNWLNIFQLSPSFRTLANHAASDTCAFCYYEFADLAVQTPSLADGFTALDMVRQTLDAVIAGRAKAYGLPSRSRINEFMSDTIPSLLIAADDYVEGSKDETWLATNYDQLKTWTDTMLATDHDGNGLIEYKLSGNSGSWPAQFVLRPANWWDTIGFGHEDAYANALAYRALLDMEQLSRQANHPEDATRYHAAADKLKAAYFKTFYNPATGILAGWRSADGQLHDYYFLWVNGIAIHYGLVPKAEANGIMDRLLAKMKEVGYTRFDLGLPGNLIPVARKDYVGVSLWSGAGQRADNADGFQRFENGSATACFTYFTLAALYDLDRVNDADRILFPMLDSYAKGNFQGGTNGMAKEWTRWDGTGSGYEGFLTDSFYALQIVRDREAALKRQSQTSQKAPMNHSSRMTTDYIDAVVSLDYPGFTGLSVDSLGKAHFPLATINPPAGSPMLTRAIQRGARVEYRRPGADGSESPRWAIEIKTNEIELESHWSASDPPEPLELNINNSLCHATLLGLMETNGSIQLPAILHFPDQGSFRISAEPQGVKSLGYTAPEHQAKVVQITFPGATQENPAVKYHWKVVSIHPAIPALETDARFDGFRRDWLNIFQLSPHWLMLANHVTSDTCAFCYYEYADIAAQTPALVKGVTALDMVRQTLDRIIGGANAYGMPGHGSFPEFASDTLPSLLIAAEDYVQGRKDSPWLAINYGHLKNWADKMLATDHDGNGLIEYALSGNSGSWPAKLKYRPSNWWDTIGFGHEDAYANALAYRALRGMEQLAQQSNQPADQARYKAAADKLKSAYFKTFYNPATGVLAGWHSADGQLHDYYFPWVNGIAIHYGLVSEPQGNAIMDHLLAKMKAVGYTRFDLGLPGNLIPVAKKDYVDSRLRFGGGSQADNSDGFQIYENGGATACFAYFTLAALYDLGRIDEGDKILFPMLEAFTQGGFQGFGDNGMSRDWKTWNGTCHGYEGFLTDNYYALLAVLDREAALKKRPETSAGNF
ncbi:MAG TPA: family 20 glycosylhydrolase [Verrucomicrobiae bacterium]